MSESEIPSYPTRQLRVKKGKKILLLLFPLFAGSRSHFQSEGDDLCPLHYPVGLREPAQVEEFNTRGFGAGGLPPLLFSHLSRNWIIHPLVVTTPLKGHTPSPPPAAATSEGAWMGRGYGPGVGLTDLPTGGLIEGDVLEVEGEGEGEGGEESPAKRVCLMVPSSEVKQYQGGRGRERPQRKAPCEFIQHCWNHLRAKSL